MLLILLANFAVVFFEGRGSMLLILLVNGVVGFLGVGVLCCSSY
jgi:hypothetical protein